MKSSTMLIVAIYNQALWVLAGDLLCCATVVAAIFTVSDWGASTLTERLFFSGRRLTANCH